MDLQLHDFISLGQLLALGGLVFRAGQMVQAFKDHVASDEQAFGALDTRLTRLERKA